MKLRLALAAIILSLTGVLMFSQIGMVNAQTGAGITPITYFTHQIKGRVAYKFFDWLFPAQYVYVTTTNKINNYKTQTNALGYYTLTVKDGAYEVRVSDKIGTPFFPQLRYLNVTQDILDVNFVGLLGIAWIH